MCVILECMALFKHFLVPHKSMRYRAKVLTSDMTCIFLCCVQMYNYIISTHEIKFFEIIEC